MINAHRAPRRPPPTSFHCLPNLDGTREKLPVNAVLANPACGRAHRARATPHPSRAGNTHTARHRTRTHGQQQSPTPSVRRVAYPEARWPARTLLGSARRRLQDTRRAPQQAGPACRPLPRRASAQQANDDAHGMGLRVARPPHTRPPPTRLGGARPQHSSTDTSVGEPLGHNCTSPPRSAEQNRLGAPITTRYNHRFANIDFSWQPLGVEHGVSVACAYGPRTPHARR